MKFLNDIGQMDRLITIRNKSNPVKDDYGQVISETNTDVVVNAKYYYQSKDESQHLNKETSIKTPQFVIRYGISVTLQSVVIYESQTYDVVDIEPIGRQQFYKITCKLVE